MKFNNDNNKGKVKVAEPWPCPPIGGRRSGLLVSGPYGPFDGPFKRLDERIGIAGAGQIAANSRESSRQKDRMKRRECVLTKCEGRNERRGRKR